MSARRRDAPAAAAACASLRAWSMRSVARHSTFAVLLVCYSMRKCSLAAPPVVTRADDVSRRSSAAITGHPTVLFSWDQDACPAVHGRRGNFETHGRCVNDVELGCDPDVADAPIKAFRTSANDVVVARCDLGSRPFIGPSLGSARHSCHVYFNSTLDYNMAMSACREWIQSPFTFPNGSTYALTHMEYHNESNQAMLWSSVTLVASHDGGRSWQHARPPPEHLVAAAPFKYDPTWQEPAYNPAAAYGFRSPSNIVESGGMFYAFVTSGWTNGPESVPVHGQPMGACLIRTSDLTDPSSWRAWGGESFNVSLAANAYTDDHVNPSEHICTPLTDMTYISLLYSTFYEAHIIVGTSGGSDAAGWSFQIAEGDLSTANWSEQIEITPGVFVKPGGNATHGHVEQPVAGTWARGVFANGTLGDKIWWLSPDNVTKHWNTLGCTPCGVPACTPAVLLNIPVKPHAFRFDCVQNPTSAASRHVVAKSLIILISLCADRWTNSTRS